MARSTNRAFTEHAKLRQSPKPKKIVSSNKDGSSQTSPLFQKGKAIQGNSKREGKAPSETPRQKKAKGSEGRKEVSPSATPIRSQAKDPAWTTVVKRGIRKEAMRPKNDGTEKTVLPHIITEPRPARPDAFKVKKCGQSTYADILRIIKGAVDLKDLEERVTSGVRKQENYSWKWTSLMS